MSDKNKNMMDQWFDMQKKALQMWQENLTPMQGKEEKVEQSSGAFQPMELFQQWQQTMTKMYKEGMSQWYPDYGFNFMSSPWNMTNPYTNLKKFYEDMVENMVKSFTQGQSASLQESINNYAQMMSDYFVPYLPHPVQNVYQESLRMQKKLFSNADDANQSMLKMTKEMQTILYRSMMGDKEAYFDYMDLVLNNTKKVAGKWMPLMGLEGDNQWSEIQKKSMDQLMAYTNQLMTLNERVTKVGQDSLKAVMDHYQDMMKNGAKPESFEAFFKTWWEFNEKAYKELFNSEDFNDLLKQMTEFGNEFKGTYEQMVEQQLQMQPFATKKDIEELKQMIKDLKK